MRKGCMELNRILLNIPSPYCAVHNYRDGNYCFFPSSYSLYCAVHIVTGTLVSSYSLYCAVHIVTGTLVSSYSLNCAVRIMTGVFPFPLFRRASLHCAVHSVTGTATVWSRAVRSAGFSPQLTAFGSAL